MRWRRTSLMSNDEWLVAASTTGLSKISSGALNVERIEFSTSSLDARKRFKALTQAIDRPGVAFSAAICSFTGLPMPEDWRNTSPKVHGRSGVAVSIRYKTRPTNRLRARSFQNLVFASTLLE